MKSANGVQEIKTILSAQSRNNLYARNFRIVRVGSVQR